MIPERLNILIVDDSAEDRELYRRLLAQDAERTYRFEEAESAEDGLRSIAGGSPDCVLLDYRLPDSNGIEMLGRLSPPASTQPFAVIMLTGQGNEAIAVEAMKAGARDYLIKGAINADALIRSVGNAVEKTRLVYGLQKQTDELARANDDLRHEVDQRRRAEQALQRNSENLERLVEARTAELSRANRLKDEFFATVSHELRTPLNAIMGWSHLLRDPDVAGDLRAQALAAIERNVRWQASLIDDILDVSRIVSGKLRLDSKLIDLAASVDTALEAVRSASTSKSIRIEARVDRPAPALGDPNRMRQVVSNLVSNAVKFTPKGGRVDVNLVTAGDEYRLSVSDTGVGIPERFLPHVFEPFRQSDASSTRDHGGLGLGLAIVKQLVELSGGTVSAQSAGPNLGSTFVITLPRPRDTTLPLEDLSQREQPAADPPNLQGIFVLAVDDDADTRRLLVALLAPYGARVVTTSSAPEAIALMSTYVPNVLLTDIAMPETDGYVLLQRVRDHPDPRVRGVPAIALTAYAGEGAEKQAFAAGFQAHLAKPFDPPVLARLVQRLGRAAVQVRR